MEIKQTKISKSISLPENTVSKIDNYKTFGELDFSGKVDVMTTDYMAIIEHSLKEIGRYFTKDEIDILINACNMLILHTYELSPALLIHNAVIMYGKHFDAEVTSDFENKILKLTTAQSFAVLRTMQSFWIDNSYDRVDMITIK